MSFQSYVVALSQMVGHQMNSDQYIESSKEFHLGLRYTGVMPNLIRVKLADGVSASLPTGWEFRAESSDNLHIVAVNITNGTCNAQFELLHNPLLNAEDLISTYSFNLMRGMASLDVTFLDRDPKFPFELQASKDGITGTIVHIFKPTTPVIHISAIAPTLSDLLSVRLIAESISVNPDNFQLSSDEELVMMTLSPDWQKISAE